jgi:DNA modification methylase
MKISRVWAMPHRYTFRIPPIRTLIREYVGPGQIWIDPFCGRYSPASITNDADENNPATYHLDGLEFLKETASNLADGALFDPPYSVEQALRKYEPSHKGTAGRTEYHARCMDEIGRIVKTGGYAICFNWNSNGIGMNRGFEIIQVLLVAHGALHNDTIVTVERKVAMTGQLL